MGALAVVGIVFPLTLPSASGKARKWIWSALGLLVVVLMWLMRI